MVTSPAAVLCLCPMASVHFPSTEGSRLSWPNWLAACQGGIPVNGSNVIDVTSTVTGGAVV